MTSYIPLHQVSMCLIAIVTFKNRYTNILKRNSLFFINGWMNAYKEKFCKNEKINGKKRRCYVITLNVHIDCDFFRICSFDNSFKGRYINNMSLMILQKNKRFDELYITES